LRAEDTEKAVLVIGMCRDEHRPLLRERYPGILKLLEQEQRISFWNIDDVPDRVGFWEKIFCRNLPSQRAASGTEHIDFAVRVLITQLVTQKDASVELEQKNKNAEVATPSESEKNENKPLKQPQPRENN
jgi:hypothetical protein